MEKQHMLDIIKELKAKHNRRTSEVLQKIVIPVIDAQATCDYAIVASRHEAKADALEELLERLQEEE